jgi:hypothetical protein
VGQHPQLDLRVVGGNNPLDLGVFGCVVHHVTL